MLVTGSCLYRLPYAIIKGPTEYGHCRHLVLFGTTNTVRHGEQKDE